GRAVMIMKGAPPLEALLGRIELLALQPSAARAYSLTETRSGRLTALTNAAAYGVRYSRCARADLVRPRRRGGVVADLHLPPARFRVRGRRDRARRSEGAPPPPPRRDGRRGSRPSQGRAVASGSGEAA